MFEKLGTPKFIANARAQGKRYTPMGVFFAFLLLFAIGGMLQSAILSPVLFVMMVADPTYYEIVNGEYATTEEMYEQIMLYTQALNEKPAVAVTTLTGQIIAGRALFEYLGIDPLVSGSEQMMHLITDGTREMVGAGYIINTDPDELVKAIIDGIEAKRAALGI